MSWLADLAAEQTDYGTVPPYVPWVPLMFPPKPAAAWGDAAVVVPWVLYERFGDEQVLRDQYDSMRTWVEQIASLAGDDHLWNAGFQFGDWLDPAAPPDRPADTRTDPYLIATAYHAYTARLLARTADVLGLAAAAEHQALADAITTAFNREYVTPSGRMASDSQTAYALALAFDLIPDGDQRRRAAERLAQLVAYDDFRIGTGFVGTPLVCDALASHGYLDEAYHLLTRDQCPSWLYPVTMGATTIWERWTACSRTDPSTPVRSRRSTTTRWEPSPTFSIGSSPDWPPPSPGIGRSSSALDPEADSPPHPPRSPRRSETHQSHGGATERPSRSTSPFPKAHPHPSTSTAARRHNSDPARTP